MANLEDDVGVLIDVVESKVCEGVGMGGDIVLPQSCKDGEPVRGLCL